MIASLYHLSRDDISMLKVTDEYSLHRIVYDLFPERDGEKNSKGFLYVDKGGDFLGRIVLILSRRPPAIPVAGRIETREVPMTFLSHEHYAFEVVVNPSKRDSKSGKTIAIRGENELRKWFMEKSTAWGFSIDASRLEVSRIGIQTFEHKQDGIVIHARATFSGVLEVTDRSAFISSFESGIGRCRGFGFGLLQLKPIEWAYANA